MCSRNESELALFELAVYLDVASTEIVREDNGLVGIACGG